MTRRAKKTASLVGKQHETQGIVATVRCQWCGKDARIVPFGYGYIAACCGHVIYSDRKLPDRWEIQAGRTKK